MYFLPLVWILIAQDGMQRFHNWQSYLFESDRYLASRRSAVDAEFVLNAEYLMLSKFSRSEALR